MKRMAAIKLKKIRLVKYVNMKIGQTFLGQIIFKVSSMLYMHLQSLYSFHDNTEQKVEMLMATIVNDGMTTRCI